MRALLIRLTRRFLLRLDPSAFFNEDASLALDRAHVEIERLRAQLYGVQR